MGKEYELKYAATRKKLDAIAAIFPYAFHEISMETTYFDTEDGDFSKRKWSLRRRLENGKAVYNLKTPITPTERREWECENGFDALAALCGEPEILTLMAKPLVPVCGARFTRRAAELFYPDFAVELALDDGVLFGGGKEEPLYEMEVELKEGKPEDADIFAQGLADMQELKPENRSKAARAMALAKGETYGL